MSIWLILGFIFVACFGLVVLRGAPYVPTKRKQAAAGLDLLNLKPGQTVYDLGSGDGVVLKMAAERGLRGVGYELNPILWLIAKLRLWPHRSMVQIKLGDFWHQDIKTADGVFVFLIGHHMEKLRAKLSREVSKPTGLVSVAYELPGAKLVKQKDGVHLYQIKPSSKL